MQLMDPPGGMPWALLGLTGASVSLNIVLAAMLLWPGAVAEPPVASSDVTEANVEASNQVADAPADEVEAPIEAPVEAPVERPEGVRVAAATVERNLAHTFHNAVGDGSDALSATTARLFVWDLDLRRDLQKGDKVSVAWRIEKDLPVIDAASYRSSKLGRTLTAYQFKASGDTFASYWSADAIEVPHRLKGGPLNGKYQQITSLLKDRPTHKGMDFKTPVGTPVVAARAGKVVRADWNWTNNGNCVEVRWADGTLARFLHLSETSVKAGQTVTASTTIGLSGNTGHSTAPHLHYELEKAGKTRDPVKVHGTERRQLSPGDRAAFDAEVQRLQGLLDGGAS
jgi:murein DD-endopeptidase